MFENVKMVDKKLVKNIQRFLIGEMFELIASWIDDEDSVPDYELLGLINEYCIELDKSMSWDEYSKLIMEKQDKEIMLRYKKNKSSGSVGCE